MTCRSKLTGLFLTLSIPLAAAGFAGAPAWAQTSPAAAPATAPAATPDAQAQQLLKQSDDLYHQRRHEPGVVGQCQSLIDQAAKLLGGDRYETLWRRAQLQYWIADGETDNSKAAAIAQKGWDYAEKAVKLNPNGVEGQFWLSVNIGLYSLNKGVVWAIAQGLEGKFNAPLDKAIKMNPRYECAGPLRVKGNYYKNLPWPKQDIKKSIELLRKSLELEPCGIRSHYYLAEAYEEDDNIPAAVAELDKILAAKMTGPDPGEVPRVQAWARKMKARLKK